MATVTYHPQSFLFPFWQNVIDFNAEVDRKVEEALAAMKGRSVIESALEESLASLRIN